MSLISETTLVLVVISMVGRFLVIVAGNTTLQMGMEVVPTVIRGQSNSILTTFGNLLTLASSYSWGGRAGYVLRTSLLVFYFILRDEH